MLKLLSFVCTILIVSIVSLSPSLLSYDDEDKEDRSDAVEFDCQLLQFNITRSNVVDGWACSTKVYKNKKWVRVTCLLDKDEDAHQCDQLDDLEVD